MAWHEQSMSRDIVILVIRLFQMHLNAWGDSKQLMIQSNLTIPDQLGMACFISLFVFVEYQNLD